MSHHDLLIVTVGDDPSLRRGAFDAARRSSRTFLEGLRSHGHDAKGDDANSCEPDLLIASFVDVS